MPWLADGLEVLQNVQHLLRRTEHIGNVLEQEVALEAHLLNFFPVIGEDEEGEMIPLDAEKVLSIPRKIKSKEVVRMGFQSISTADHSGMVTPVVSCPTDRVMVFS